MTSAPITLRMVNPNDAPVLAAIYAPYVRETAVSFEYEPPSNEEFAGRIREVLEKYPYLAAVRGEEILGYAYAHPYGVRKAYSHSAELSVAQNITNLYVLVAGVEVEDAYLTHDSQKFHLAMGYDYVGKLHKAGYKFGHWYDMITMEKLIAPHPEYTQPDVVTWQELDEEIFAQAGVVK